MSRKTPYTSAPMRPETRDALKEFKKDARCDSYDEAVRELLSLAREAGVSTPRES